MADPKRTKEAILSELEALITEYMQAGAETGALMLDSFVLKARAVDTTRLDEQARMGITIWLCPTNQDVFKSIGLAEALREDISRYYDSLFEDADLLGDDDA